jgi:hypothetical protein
MAPFPVSGGNALLGGVSHRARVICAGDYGSCVLAEVMASHFACRNPGRSGRTSGLPQPGLLADLRQPKGRLPPAIPPPIGSAVPDIGFGPGNDGRLVREPDA